MCSRGTTPRRYQMCRRQNQRATYETRKEGLKVMLTWPIYSIDPARLVPTPQTSYNYCGLADTQQLLIPRSLSSSAAEMHAACSRSPHNGLHSQSTLHINGLSALFIQLDQVNLKWHNFSELGRTNYTIWVIETVKTFDNQSKYINGVTGYTSVWADQCMVWWVGPGQLWSDRSRHMTGSKGHGFISTI